MVRLKTKRRVEQRELKQYLPEVLERYGEEFHVEKIPSPSDSSVWAQDIDPPIGDLIVALADEVPCIKTTKDSCAGKAWEQVQAYQDKDFKPMHVPCAYVELLYDTGDEQIHDAQKLDDELTTKIFKFGRGENAFQGKFACMEREYHNLSVSEEFHRSYDLVFDKPATPEMLANMWDVFREKVEPFKLNNTTT